MAVRQRDQFAAYLRSHGVVRRDSHMLARDPGARHWMIKGSDGWIRTLPVDDDRFFTIPWMRRKLARAGISVVEAYIIRFKREPA